MMSSYLLLTFFLINKAKKHTEKVMIPRVKSRVTVLILCNDKGIPKNNESKLVAIA